MGWLAEKFWRWYFSPVTVQEPNHTQPFALCSSVFFSKPPKLPSFFSKPSKLPSFLSNMWSPAFPMCQIWAPAGINLTPRMKICPLLCYKLLQSKTGPVLGSVSPVVKSQPSRVSRVVKSRPVATRSSISSSKGDPKCGLKLMTLAVKILALTSLTTYAGTWFQSVVRILILSCQG